MKNVLITGGAGFVGSHLVDKLIVKQNISKINVLDDFSTGRIENLIYHRNNKKVRIIKGDVRDINILRKITKGLISYII